ncbi:AAA family ATPase [Haemophilus haemolyticus]|uniref:AAA family ATPase n=1 Tax=Haemophilus haemolyticus TaxID=726 RepID=UPI000E5908AE|nr:AAA family ATPase [Haemophilus haemolyticus]
MKLKNLSILNLFGILNYNVNFGDSNVNIITAPNGYGKTVILNIISSIINNDFSYLVNLKFKSLSLEFEDFNVTVEKLKNSLNIKVNETNEVILIPSGFDSFNVNNFKLNSNELSKYTDNIEVLFIRDQRIPSNINLLKNAASELRNLINSAHLDSAKISQELDGEFIARLFHTLDNSSKTSIDSLEQRLLGIQDKLIKYSKYDLVNIKNIEHNIVNRGSITNGNMFLLKLYVDDMLLKLEPIDYIFSKIELFENIINESVLSFKKIIFSRDDGFYLISNNGSRIDYDLLSSGEKNQLIMIFNLIFNSHSYDVVLIDEPEISLHVSWQSNFINSILKIKNINLFDNVIISTHSPTIIGNYWGWVCDLSDLLEGDSVNGN